MNLNVHRNGCCKTQLKPMNWGICEQYKLSVVWTMECAQLCSEFNLFKDRIEAKELKRSE